MNKTKRKIFETSMKLFAEKGYEATSIEEITATVGVAKGTLYYHFSSKEEIFNFLIEEGMKLLQNSIDIKTAKYTNYIDKLKAIVLIQIKIVVKYEDINKIEDIVKKGIERGEIKKGDSKVIASEIYGLICSILVYKLRNGKEIDIMNLYKEIENTVIEGLRVK